MNYLIAKEDIKIKGFYVFKGSKYILNSEGYLHSFNDLPALIKSNGSQYWFLNGKFHREDGLALIYPSGHQEWWLNGKCHRTNGPAVIFPNGTQEWWVNGERHRSDGPAIIYPSGYQVWYLNGKPVHPIEVLKLMKAKGIDITHFALDKDKRVREAVKQLL